MELYDRITNFLVGEYIGHSVQKKQLRCLRLVSPPFNRSATRILLCHISITMRHLRDYMHPMRRRRAKGPRFIFDSDFCDFVRVLAIRSHPVRGRIFVERWLDDEVEGKAYENFLYFLSRIPSVERIHINSDCYNYEYLLVNSMFKSFRHAQLPQLKTLKIHGLDPRGNQSAGLSPALDDVLQELLPQLRILNLRYDGHPSLDKAKFHVFHFLHLGRGLRSVNLDGLGRPPKYPCPMHEPVHPFLHPCASIERISLSGIMIPYEMLATICNYRKSLVYLHLTCVYLLTGTWADFCQELGECPNLKTAIISWRCGYYYRVPGQNTYYCSLELSASDTAAMTLLRRKAKSVRRARGEKTPELVPRHDWDDENVN
ncbi:hypothetical protein BO94DRAFT_579823 [Aspergillus sclerotioniger CBS 115572]|uniref:F-box domain-containing protein n=1 Tax=Aspergillus sclerotioniger CBS 115572 TaxID=1450535 RepID=A0A317UVK8_9EURO|nr:hypothetical protein BO94DRAFT_579823 [Aspergillus sclerotioniger CBS 115572]PWY65665.1 hypothetical protein BO94DRAFT_579823 [Aspergillus sclerotioniger CBS 115572]